MNKWFLSLFLALTTVDMGIKQYIEDTWKKGEERDTILPGIICRIYIQRRAAERIQSFISRHITQTKIFLLSRIGNGYL